MHWILGATGTIISLFLLQFILTKVGCRLLPSWYVRLKLSCDIGLTLNLWFLGWSFHQFRFFDIFKSFFGSCFDPEVFRYELFVFQRLIVDHIFEQNNLFSIANTLKIFQALLKLLVISLTRNLLLESGTKSFHDTVKFRISHFRLFRKQRNILFELNLQEDLLWLYLDVQRHPGFKA